MKTIAVWFSCGAASAVAAKKTIELYGDTHIVRVINNPVFEEHSDNTRFLCDVADWLGQPIETAINPKYPIASIKEVFADRRYMSGPAGAPCTVELKKKARQHWERNNDFDYMVLGFTKDEQHRHERFTASEMLPVIPVLIDAGLSKGDCFKILADAGIRLPEIYNLGFPNANCIGCVKASSSTYWNHVRKVFPEVFEERAVQSRAIGCKLVYYKGKRIYLDELPVDAKGRSLKSYKPVECGILCEMK